MAKSKTVPLENIQLDGDTQPRAEIDEDLVVEYVEAIRAGAKFPPIVLFFDGAKYWLADGFHRYWSARRLEWTEIAAEVRKGTLQDARWYSYAANQAHGARRNNEDKRKAVQAALRHPKGAKMSDRQIAEHVGVASNTVLKYRQELESTAQIAQSSSRTGRDGRTIDTRNIGRVRASRSEVDDATEEGPPPRKASPRITQARLDTLTEHFHSTMRSTISKWSQEDPATDQLDVAAMLRDLADEYEE